MDHKIAATVLGGACAGAAAMYLMMGKNEDSAEKRESEFLASQRDRTGLPLAASKSSYFEDVADYKLLLTKEEIDLGVQRVADEIEKRFMGEKIVICGILKGAFIFITDLCRALKRPYR